MADGYNWFLIIVAIVVTVLMGVMNVYILIHFQHPEDRNQAWLPKIVVVLGLTLAVLSVLMFPLDVGNRGACSEDIVLSACKFSLPMKELWMFVYMAMAILVLFVIPFTLFYYEADSEYTLWQKIWSASQWVIVTFIVVALTLGIAYGLAGYVEYDVEQVDSGMVPLAATGLGANLRTCLIPGCTPQPPSYNNCFGGQLCDGAARDEQGIGSKEEWSLRTSFPVYMIAVISILGWLLFMVFAGVGVFALPVDWIKAFAYRPRTTITRSEYISEAIKMEKRAKEVQVLAKSLRREEQERGKSRKWRKQLNMLNQQLVMLEEDETALREVYPQGEEREMAWTMTCIGYWGKLVGGILGCVVSLMWLIHVVLFMFISPPVHPFLNDFFIDLDGVFPLFGTAAFAFFCFYLMMITVKGCMTLGLRLVFFTIHPMRVGATLMSSFLFNVALILLCSVAVIQFCAQAFSVYAIDTDIQEIFGNEIMHLRGLKYLYIYNVFLYCFLIFAVAGVIWVSITPAPKKKTLEEIYAE